MDHKNEFKKCFPDLLFCKCCLAEYEIGIKSSVDENVDSGKAENMECGVAKYLFYSNRFCSKQFHSCAKKIQSEQERKIRTRQTCSNSKNCDIKIYMPEESTPNTIAQMALPCINKEVGEFSSKICQIFIFTFFAGFYLWKVCSSAVLR